MRLLFANIHNKPHVPLHDYLISRNNLTPCAFADIHMIAVSLLKDLHTGQRGGNEIQVKILMKAEYIHPCLAKLMTD